MTPKKTFIVIAFDLSSNSWKINGFTINKNLVFSDSLQFMNSSLDALVEHLSDNDFKFL